MVSMVKSDVSSLTIERNVLTKFCQNEPGKSGTSGGIQSRASSPAGLPAEECYKNKGRHLTGNYNLESGTIICKKPTV